MSEGEFGEKSEPRPERKHVSARVPDSVAKGEFCTGVVVMASANELVLDFIQTLVQPNQLVARVVLSWKTVPSLLGALKQNLENHGRRFNRPEPQPAEIKTPAPVENKDRDSNADVSDDSDSGDGGEGGEKVVAGKPAAGSPSAPAKPMTRKVEPTGFYDELRFDDSTLRGVYANGAMINHTEFEFKLDFLSTLHPYPVVVSRIFMSEPQMQRLLASLEQHDSRRH